MDKTKEANEDVIVDPGRKKASAEDGARVTADLSGAARGSNAPKASWQHPSRSLGPRAKGYGIGGGYERPYRRERTARADNRKSMYGPLPLAGYYGAGMAARPFKLGQASFSSEMEWYKKQYGERTSGFEGEK